MANDKPPVIPNFNPNNGRLVTDRFDFQSHIDGNNFRQAADTIDVIPNVTIDGYAPIANLQQAITTLSQIVNPVIPTADQNTLGVIKLSPYGDVQGNANLLRVVNIQGIPISAVAPSAGDLLTFNGTSWMPQVNSIAFTANGDLSGSNSTQSVLSATGVSGHYFQLNCDFIQWMRTTSTGHPFVITAADCNGFGEDIWIRAQSSTGTNNGGGRTLLIGGAPGPGGKSGSVALMHPSFAPAVQVCSPTSETQIVTGLACREDIISTFMPANTGNGVIFIRDAATNPSTGIPAGGTILYSNAADGTLHVKQSNGLDFSLGGSNNNPTKWGSQTIGITPSFTDGGAVYTFRSTSVSPAASNSNIFSVVIPDNCAVSVEVTLVGHISPTNTGSLPSAGSSAQYKMLIGYEAYNSALNTLGTLTMVDVRGTTSYATQAAISSSGNTVTVTTGYHATLIIDWTAQVKLTFAT